MVTAMLGLEPSFGLVVNLDFRPDVASTAHAASPRCVDSACDEAAAWHDTCLARFTCFATPFRNFVPLFVRLTVWPWKPPDLNVATTLGATTFAPADAVRFFDDPNLRPSSFSFTFTPGTDFAIFFRVALFRTMRTFVKRLPFDFSVFEPRPTRFLPTSTSTRQLRRLAVSARQPIVIARFTSRSGLSTIAVSGLFAFAIVIWSVPVTGGLCPSSTASVALYTPGAAIG